MFLNLGRGFFCQLVDIYTKIRKNPNIKINLQCWQNSSYVQAASGEVRHGVKEESRDDVVVYSTHSCGWLRLHTCGENLNIRKSLNIQYYIT